jgi:four helix bundle protein
MFEFAVNVVQLVDAMPSTLVGRHIGGQLLRSGTSTAANYEEACTSESRADFIHKLTISSKEAHESRFWLRLANRTILRSKNENASVLSESEELCRILTSSIVTAKANAGKRNNP